MSVYGVRINKLEKDIMHVSGLRHLRRLAGHYISNCSIIDAFADNNVPIESLEIIGWNPHIVDSIARLTSINYLSLSFFSYEMVVDLVMKLPALEHLKFFRCAHLSLNGLKRMLEQSDNLKSLKIHDFNMLIDSENLIDSILDLIIDRIKVEINVKSENIFCQFNEYHFANSYWLFISASIIT